MATPSRPFWWRFPAPATLVGAAILFNLPWLEVQCNGPTGSKMVLSTQTGLQTALGRTTEGEGMQDLEKQKRSMGAMGETIAISATKPSEKHEPAHAPLMVTFGVVICAGILLGLAFPLQRTRRWLVGLWAAGAMAILAAQLVIGFPIAEDVAKFNKQMQSMSGGAGGPRNPLAGSGAEGALGNPLAGGAAAGAEAMSMKVGYTPWYYLTWGCLAASLLLVIVEAVTARSAARSPAAAAAASNSAAVT